MFGIALTTWQGSGLLHSLPLGKGLLLHSLPSQQEHGMLMLVVT